MWIVGQRCNWCGLLAILASKFFCTILGFNSSSTWPLWRITTLVGGWLASPFTRTISKKHTRVWSRCAWKMRLNWVRKEFVGCVSLKWVWKGFVNVCRMFFLPNGHLRTGPLIDLPKKQSNWSFCALGKTGKREVLLKTCNYFLFLFHGVIISKDSILVFQGVPPKYRTMAKHLCYRPQISTIMNTNKITSSTNLNQTKFIQPCQNQSGTMTYHMT